MERNERIAIEATCTRLVNEFSWCTDTFDYDGAVSLFIPDCTFSRGNESFEGIGGLRTILDRRPRDRRTCHIVSGIVVDVIDRDTATGKAHALVFGYRGALKEGEEAPLGAPDSIVGYEVQFRRTDAGWRIAKWHIGLNFRRPST